MSIITDSLITKWKRACLEAQKQGVSPVAGCHKVCMHHLGIDEKHPNCYDLVDELEDEIFQEVILERS